MNTEIICRLCISKTRKTKSIEIFSENGNFLNISNIIKKYFWFDVQQNETLQSICKRCWKNILNFHNYYKSIEIAQHTLYVKKSSPSEELITNPKIDIHYYNNAVADVLKIVGEAEDSDKSTVTFKNPFESVLIKNETIDDNIQPFLETECKEIDEIENEYKNPELNVNNKTECLEDNKNNEVNSNNVKTKKSNEDEMIQKYFDMNCDLCDAKFSLFGDARRHYKRVHKKLGYITCCTKKFFRRCKIVEHILYHQNPLTFQCKICNKAYSDKVGLREHTETHIPMNEKLYKCDICIKRFTKQYRLTTHKKIKHSLDTDKQYRCEICYRTFVYKSLLTYHIKLVHELKFSRICDICAKTFKNATSYEQHCSIEHSENVLKKYQCEICGTWLKHERGYLVHMKTHKEKGQTCQYCGKSSTNKKAMTAHIKRVHLNVRTYSCTICNKILKSAQSLKEHMPQHTGDTLYSCTCCEKRFNSSANMYAHRKRAHPKEHAENKGLRTKLLTQNEKKLK